MRSGPWPGSARRLAVLLAFALAMGWLEGVVVVYIRNLLGFEHGAGVPPAAEVARRFRALPWLLPTEQTREAATLVMLLALAWLGAPTFRSRIGAFLFIFGVWDITYYVALYALVRWPPTPATMDLLFLIPPGPWWYQPVWIPVLISCVFVAGGLVLYRGAERHIPRGAVGAPGLPAQGNRRPGAG